jgi:hypothetical protein
MNIAAETWLPIDEQQHLITLIVTDGLPVWYVDGKVASRQSGTAVFNRKLTREEIEAHYRALFGSDNSAT